MNKNIVKFYSKRSYDEIGLFISESANKMDILNATCGARFNYVFVPIKYKDTDVECVLELTIQNNDKKFGEIYFY